MFNRHKQMPVDELATELHNCGLDAWRNYENMGKSRERWDIFRKQLAKEMAEEWGADAYGQCASLSINVIKHLLNIEQFPSDRLGEGIIIGR